MGVLADGASAACFPPFIAPLPDRCFAICKTKGRDKGEQGKFTLLTASKTFPPSLVYSPLTLIYNYPLIPTCTNKIS